MSRITSNSSFVNGPMNGHPDPGVWGAGGPLHSVLFYAYLQQCVPNWRPGQPLPLVETADGFELPGDNSEEVNNRLQKFELWVRSTLSRSGVPADELPTELPEEWFNLLPPPVASLRRRRSLRDRLERPARMSWLFEDLVAANQPLLLGGKSKMLKTTLALAAALALVSGRPFLDRFAVPAKKRVLIFSGESGDATIDETLDRMVRSMGLTPAQVSEFSDRLDICDWVPNLADPQTMRDFCRVLQDFRPDVVMIDPMYQVIPGDDAANIHKMGGYLARLHQPIQDIGATMWLLHHFKKGSAHNRPAWDPPELEDFAYAGYDAFARQWLLLGRRAPFVDGSGEHSLWLRSGGSAGHSSLWGLDVRERAQGPHLLPGRIWHTTIRSERELEAATAAVSTNQVSHQVIAAANDIQEWLHALPDQSCSQRQFNERCGTRQVYQQAQSLLLRENCAAWVPNDRGRSGGGAGNLLRLTAHRLLRTAEGVVPRGSPRFTQVQTQPIPPTASEVRGGAES